MECDLLYPLMLQIFHGSPFVKVKTINDDTNYPIFAVYTSQTSRCLPTPQVATKDITSRQSLEQDGTVVE